MKKILLVVSLISVLLLTGCNSNHNNERTDADYVNLSQEISRKEKTIRDLENQVSELQKYKIEEEKNNAVTVEDVANYTDAYYHLFHVKLPKVNGNTNTINELNQKILNDVLPVTYTDVATHASVSKAFDKGSTYDYQYIIKDNILVIDIYSTTPEDGSGAPTSGGGLQEFAYYYDIEEDRIINVEECAEKVSLSLEGLTNLDGSPINSYAELEENHYLVTISNNELQIKFFN